MTDSDDDDFVPSKKSTSRMRDFSLSIPSGNILVNRKWSSSALAAGLAKVFTLRYDTNLDVVDFQPASNVLVLYLTEADIVSGTEDLARKLSQLGELCHCNTKISITWLYLLSELTGQYFQEFQQKIVVETSNTIIPISSQDQVGQVLQQLQLASHRANPFKSSKKVINRSHRLHKDILHAVIKLPGMGEKKSRNLLEKFDSIQKISVGSQQELSGVLGANLARGVADFFDTKL